MNIADYFHLTDRFTFVAGARHALLLDLETGGVHRPNEGARRIIQLSEQGLTIEQALDALDAEFTPSDVLAFIEALCSEGLMTLSRHPKAVYDNKPLPLEPDFLWMEITPQCNLRCIHCYAESGPDQQGGLSTGVLTRVLDQAGALGYRRVQFTGGECTLRDDLPLLISHARTRGFEFVEVFTNGTLLSERMIRFFSHEGVHVALSLHSYRAEVHDVITGVNGSFDKTMTSLEYLLAYKVPVRCTTIAMKENEQDLTSTNYFLDKLGVFASSADTIRPTGRGRNMDRWPENYGLTTVRSRPRFSISRAGLERNRRRNSCWHGKATVTSSGDVIPCIFARDQVAGNIGAHDLAEIIRGEAMNKFWSLTYDSVEVCRDCEYRFLCRDCRPWAHGATGNLYGKTPRCAYDPYKGEWTQVVEKHRISDSCIGLFGTKSG
jgi:radical SAM protein with 4Fe4S-binding SPASM domain